MGIQWSKPECPAAAVDSIVYRPSTFRLSPTALVTFVSFETVLHCEGPNAFVEVVAVMIGMDGEYTRYPIGHTFRVKLQDGFHARELRTLYIYDDAGETASRDVLDGLANVRVHLVHEMDLLFPHAVRARTVVVANALDGVLCTLFGLPPAFKLLPRPDARGRPGDTFDEWAEVWCSALAKMRLLQEHTEWMAESEMIRNHRRHGFEPADYLFAVRLALPNDDFLLSVLMDCRLFDRLPEGLDVDEDDEWETVLSFASPVWRALYQYRHFCHGV